MKKETKKLNRLITKVEGKINKLTKKINDIELKFDSPTDAMLITGTLPGSYKSAKADYLRIQYRAAMESKSMFQDLLKALVNISNRELKPDQSATAHEPHIVQISDTVTLESVEVKEQNEDCEDCLS